MKKIIRITTALLLAAAMLLTACACGAAASKTDYLVLVNKENKLPEDWEQNLKTVKYTNSVGDEVETEEQAYKAYLKLKKDLEKEGIKEPLATDFTKLK